MKPPPELAANESHLRRQVVFVCYDVIDTSMAGTGIRQYQLGRVLAQEHDVTIAIPNAPAAALTAPGLRFHQYRPDDWRTIESLIRNAAVCLIQSDIAAIFPQLAETQAVIVVDGYTPLLAEFMSGMSAAPLEEQVQHWELRMLFLAQQFAIGDFFLCASERQRDYWLGMLEAFGRINPATMQADSTLRNLIDIVPYALSGEEPRHSRKVIRGVWPGIGADDKVLLWGGGLWPWLDPLTAIRAVAHVWAKRQDVRLIFPGTLHPNPQMAALRTHTANAMQLAEDLALRDKAVFFGDWVPYPDWDNVLCESDVALTLHHEMLESRLAYRSRLFDYIRADLPTVATRGDATADLVAQHQLGICVEPEDVMGVAQAILELLDEPRTSRAARFAHMRRTLTWENAAQPLLRFCRNPTPAADKVLWGQGLGNPATRDLGRQLRAAQALIARYEQGRFMRTMRAIDQIRRKVVPGRGGTE
jgi:hypothetical protein